MVCLSKGNQILFSILKFPCFTVFLPTYFSINTSTINPSTNFYLYLEKNILHLQTLMKSDLFRTHFQAKQMSLVSLFFIYYFKNKNICYTKGYLLHFLLCCPCSGF